MVLQCLVEHKVCNHSALGPALIHHMCPQCTAGEPGAPVVHPTCAPRVPAVHFCPIKLPIAANFRDSDGGMMHCRA